ncbi:MAG: ABC transporter substrate-binding protein [Reinekea sp.]
MKTKTAALAMALVSLPSLVLAADLNLLHNWHTASASKALDTLIHKSQGQDLKINGRVVAKPEHDSLTAMRNLAVSMNGQPTMVSLSLQELQRWDDLQLLQHLERDAATDSWMAKLPEFVRSQIIYHDQIIAAPIAIHMANWLYVNKPLLDETGLEVGSSWDDFTALLNALADRNITPILHDGSVMQDMVLFESVLLATAGSETYLKSFQHLNSQALREAEPDVLKTFKRLEQMKPYISRLPAGTSEQEVAARLLSNEAAMVIQGDWFRGEFALSGKIANQNYYCLPIPGEYQPGAYSIDLVAALKASDDTLSASQKKYLDVQMTQDVQYLFNNYDGGLPAMTGVGLEGVNECVAYAAQRLNNAHSSQTLVPSLSQGVLVRDTVYNAVEKVVSQFMTGSLSPEKAAVALRKGIKRAGLF